MFEGKSIVDAARQIAAISLATVIIAIGPLYAAHAAQSKGGKATASEEGATSPAVAEFIALLGDPKVQKWLEEQHAAEVSHKPAPDAETSSVSDYFDSRVRATREHITALGSALPDLPNQFERGVGLLQAEIPRRGTVLFLVLVFAGLGLGVEWLFRKATQKTRQRLDGFPMETVNDRLRLVAARFAFAFGVVAAFAIGRRPSPSAVSAPSWRSIGRRSLARWYSAISSPCSSPVSRWSSAIFCSPPMPSASASFQRIRWPLGSGADGSPCSSAGLLSAMSLSAS